MSLLRSERISAEPLDELVRAVQKGELRRDLIIWVCSQPAETRKALIDTCIGILRLRRGRRRLMHLVAALEDEENAKRAILRFNQ